MQEYSRIVFYRPAGFWYPAGYYGGEIMKTRNMLLLIGVLLYAGSFLVACNFRAQERTSLFNGTVYLQNTDVPLIHLKGQEILCNSFLNPSWQFQTKVFLQDSILTLIRNNWRQRHTEFRYYSFPDMQLIKSDDFPLSSSSTVIPAADSTLLYYLLELSWSQEQQNWFTIDLSGQMTRLDSLTLPIRRNQTISSITHIGNKDFIYQQGSVIIRASITEEGTFANTLFRIPLYSCRGELLINTAKNRMVFAHRHYHLFYIMNLKADTIKTVDFKNGIHYYCDEITTSHWNPNMSYYVDAFAGENYFYLLFWGHNLLEAFWEHSRRGWRRVEGGLNSAVLNRYESVLQAPHNQQLLRDIVELYADQFTRT
jgi:hypothetical protein